MRYAFGAFVFLELLIIQLRLIEIDKKLNALAPPPSSMPVAPEQGEIE